MTPTPDQALAFYRAALPAARLLDRDSGHRVLDADADPPGGAYGADLPAVVRCDIVHRNLAMLYRPGSRSWSAPSPPSPSPSRRAWA